MVRDIRKFHDTYPLFVEDTAGSPLEQTQALELARQFCLFEGVVYPTCIDWVRRNLQEDLCLLVYDLKKPIGLIAVREVQLDQAPQHGRPLYWIKQVLSDLHYESYQEPFDLKPRMMDEVIARYGAGYLVMATGNTTLLGLAEERGFVPAVPIFGEQFRLRMLHLNNAMPHDFYPQLAIDPKVLVREPSAAPKRE